MPCHSPLEALPDFRHTQNRLPFACRPTSVRFYFYNSNAFISRHMSFPVQVYTTEMICSTYTDVPPSPSSVPGCVLLRMHIVGTLRVGASELRPVEEEPRDRREGVRRRGAVGRADGRGAVVGVDAGPPTDRSRRTSSRDGRADTDARVAEGRGGRERGRPRCSSTSGPPGACRRPPCCPVNERSESAVTPPTSSIQVCTMLSMKR